MDRGVSIGLGATAMARDLELTLGLTLATDSSAALAVRRRKGVVKIPHLHTPLLWLQSRVRDGESQIETRKVKGTDNVSDIATNAVGEKNMFRQMETCGCQRQKGQSSLALKAQGLGQSGCQSDNNQSDEKRDEKKRPVKFSSQRTRLGRRQGTLMPSETCCRGFSLERRVCHGCQQIVDPIRGPCINAGVLLPCDVGFSN
eukprot:289367-Amphidinium_carterae.1